MINIKHFIQKLACVEKWYVGMKVVLRYTDMYRMIYFRKNKV